MTAHTNPEILKIIQELEMMNIQEIVSMVFVVVVKIKKITNLISFNINRLLNCRITKTTRMPK
jgi:hypothetical protein